jgi:beta-phosphoglucomutase-like phosphatase (HAD superfamily)
MPRITRHPSQLFPGIEAVLDRLNRHGILYAIGSNGRHKKMEIVRE